MTEAPNFSTDLTGQTALVTGTTSGLGRRFAEVLAGSRLYRSAPFGFPDQPDLCNERAGDLQDASLHY